MRDKVSSVHFDYTVEMVYQNNDNIITPTVRFTVSVAMTYLLLNKIYSIIELIYSITSPEIK